VAINVACKLYAVYLRYSTFHESNLSVSVCGVIAISAPMFFVVAASFLDRRLRMVTLFPALPVLFGICVPAVIIQRNDQMSRCVAEIPFLTHRVHVKLF
jgi:hypothetical protein